jgi:hypothetical protein
VAALPIIGKPFWQRCQQKMVALPKKPGIQLKIRTRRTLD